ncbi:MAG TPA: serine/threonine-protein kinase [Kofleriaceae bacterium]|nr:serine/threonine-protein kinase [Kofleriaceae bacterium]
MTLKVGDSVEGRYKILKELDRGGMGSVFLAEHQLIKRRVALKLLRADLAEDADVLERFMNEARAAGTLGHPNIVESTDMGFTREGVPYIVFEFLEGSLLTDEIYRVRGLPPRRVFRIARQIASALHAAHQAGIVHRDLKSDNVFLTDRDESNDHVKVLDFGISRFLEAEDSPRDRAMVVGTPQFMAPEQITNPAAVDRRTDVYALGVIIYEMLAAARPFEADNDPDALFKQIVSDAPPPIEIPDMPPGFETMLVERFLAKNPDDRFNTMADVEAALSAFAGIVRPPGRDSQPMPYAVPVGEPAEASVAKVVALPSPPPRRASIAWLVAAIVAAAAGAALLVADPKQTAGPDPNLALVKGDADKLASAIDSATHAAQLRVDGLAQTPMLRAGVETDVATVNDMFKNEFSLKLNPGETFELLQKRDGELAAMLRVPKTAALSVRADHQPRLHVVKPNGLEVVVSTPVSSQRGDEAGAVAIATAIDLAPVISQLQGHVQAAELRGLDAPIVLVASHGGAPAGSSTEIPVALPKELAAVATLAATLPPPLATAPTFGWVRLGCWALAGILGILYFVNLLRARRTA